MLFLFGLGISLTFAVLKDLGKRPDEREMFSSFVRVVIASSGRLVSTILFMFE